MIKLIAKLKRKFLKVSVVTSFEKNGVLTENNSDRKDLHLVFCGLSFSNKYRVTLT